VPRTLRVQVVHSAYMDSYNSIVHLYGLIIPHKCHNLIAT